MKKNLVKLASITAVFALGIGLAINTQKQPIAVEAAQHTANYADYTYSGDYYNALNTNGTDGLSGSFRKALSTLIFPKAWYSYSGGGGNANYLSGALQEADEDPTNSNNMVYLYTRDSVAKNPASSWNREHVWPQSLSGPSSSNRNWGETEAGTDILHLRPTYNETNRIRGNQVYGYISKNKQTLTYNDMIYGYTDGTYFEPLDAVKGDVARIVMYVWTAYNDYYSSGLNIKNTFASYDTLLKWHTMDKPDALEGVRNDFSEQSKQKNRNPFVDHPEYAWRIFGDSCSNIQVKNDCMVAYPAEGYVPSGQGGQGGESGQGGQGSGTNTSIAGTYSVTFANNSKDGDSEISGTTIMSSQMTSNTLVASVAGGSKVFAGVSGLKLGSSKAIGEISFELKEEVQGNICKIEIESDQYGSDSGKLVVKLDDETITSNITPGTTYEENLDNLSASTITISTTEKRAYLSKITITVAEEETQEPPVDNPPVDNPPVDNPPVDNPGESTSEQPVDNSTPYDPSVNPDPPVVASEPEKEKGCGGSIIATTSLFAISALAGLSFIFIKRRRY